LNEEDVTKPNIGHSVFPPKVVMTQTERILILDDDPNLRKTLTDILQHKGYRPRAVEKSRESQSANTPRAVAVGRI
ncbi:MAG: hypothetical protein RMJ60_07660, partial [Anaerolineales bacterium]|nr:hypothetical protein [Anaerolineales bacterium]